MPICKQNRIHYVDYIVCKYARSVQSLINLKIKTVIVHEFTDWKQDYRKLLSPMQWIALHELATFLYTVNSFTVSYSSPIQEIALQQTIFPYTVNTVALPWAISTIQWIAIPQKLFPSIQWPKLQVFSPILYDSE